MNHQDGHLKKDSNKKGKTVKRVIDLEAPEMYKDTITNKMLQDPPQV